MKAAVFQRSGLPLSIENIADPEPQPDQMILKVCACGICGTTWASMRFQRALLCLRHTTAAMPTTAMMPTATPAMAPHAGEAE